MDTIGIIDPERLHFLPKKHWKAHEFCFFLHDSIARLLVEYEAKGLQNLVSNAFQKMFEEHNMPEDDIDLLSFLKEKKLIKPYKFHLITHLTMALTSDMLHFLYESFICIEKRKFSVAFSLLRKPFKENLLFLAWLLGDEDDFLERFSANNYQTLNHTGKEQRIKILTESINKLPHNNAFDADLIHDIIYSKNLEAGFEPIWQRATHLITSMGKLLKTEDYNINFIFNYPFDNRLLDTLYSGLPYLMFFATQICLGCFNKIHGINEKTFGHLLLTTMGCYEALFLKGDKQSITSMLNNSLKQFLKCLHCDAPLRINKSNAPQLFLTEKVQCKKCGLLSDVPLYWLLGFSKILITTKDDFGPSHFDSLIA